MKRRILISALTLLLTFSSCAPAPKEEPTVTVSATEEPTSPPETTAEETAAPETAEETKQETTEPETSAEETTEPAPDFAGMTADELLLLSRDLASSYGSYVLIAHTETDIDIMGDTIYRKIDSELRVKGGNAVFRQGNDEGYEHLYLVKNELYREGLLGKYRIGGYDMSSFLAEFAELIPLSFFRDGTAEHTQSEIILRFPALTDEGIAHLRSKLELDADLLLNTEKSELCLTLDKEANMQKIGIELKFSILDGDEEIMNVSIISNGEQSQPDEDIWLELPRAEDFIYFPSNESVVLYEKLCTEIKDFTSSHLKYEYDLHDDMHIKSDGVDLPLTSNTKYAYNNRIGASIEKAFDIADGTGPHKILTHFNLRRGFSQIDGGSIFVDTTINKNNLEYTLSRPFETSFFALGNCTRMDSEKSGDTSIAFLLNLQTARAIAGDLLLRAGVISTPELSGVAAYTYIETEEDGSLKAIGYDFSAKASVSGKEYDLTRSVRLEIVSDNSANVKVIYIEVEDDDEE